MALDRESSFNPRTTSQKSGAQFGGDAMAAVEQAGGLARSPAAGLLDRERIVAKAGFNRWLVPPAALCIHLCIGMAYGFSVFWLPLSRAIGISKSVDCPDMSILQELVTT